MSSKLNTETYSGNFIFRGRIFTTLNVNDRQKIKKNTHHCSYPAQNLKI